MEPEWQVIIGMGIAGIVRELYLLLKNASEPNERVNPSMKLGFTSLIFSILGIIPFVSILGIIFGIMSIRKKERKTLAIIGITVSSIFILMWLAVLFIGT